MINRMDWALLVIAAADGEPVSPVQLQKSLFLIGKNIEPVENRLGGFYNFRPFDYGPFDSDVYRDAEILAAKSLVAISSQPGRSYREYAATASGLEEAGKIDRQLEPSIVRYVREIVAWARSLSFNDLVRAIYRQYPEQRTRSVFNF